MGHLDHAAFGRLTSVLSYAMACIGAAPGLRCSVRALGATGRSRRNRLVTAASAIGTGIWTVHFVAVLGFGVGGTGIRYDVPLTVALRAAVERAELAAGLASGASTGLGRADAEHLATVASGFHSLAEGAGRHFGAGGVRQTVVEMDDVFPFAAALTVPARPSSPS
ncbi:roadblock/LC7 domain-containing protein [Streptomyces sp. NPDC088766]|uniref:roadblock/LC7 domain-containing protein n=1 Tax=Streptomyces sp. NPDC088766 TaxID=3365893 RepID=UPI00382261DE